MSIIIALRCLGGKMRVAQANLGYIQRFCLRKELRVREYNSVGGVLAQHTEGVSFDSGISIKKVLPLLESQNPLSSCLCLPSTEIAAWTTVLS